MSKIFWLVSCALVFSGCGLIALGEIPEGAEFRKHTGIKIYNAGPKDEAQWQKIYQYADENYKTFIACVGNKGAGIARSMPIILFPENLVVFGKRVNGWNDLKYVYLSKERRSITIAHEWLHDYLYKYKGYIAGDINHADELWDKCGLR